MNARARILIIQNMIGCMSVLKNLKKACIVYCRVSLASQKPDLENQIRATFGLEGTPVRILARERGEGKGK